MLIPNDYYFHQYNLMNNGNLETKMNKFGWRLLVAIAMGYLFLSGCQSTHTIPIPSPTKNIAITPYLTSTPKGVKDIKTVTPTGNQKTTTIPTATPTPLLYQVAKNDTLTGIAFKHGVKLNDLIAANPNIDPNFLTIGITLTIPISGTTNSSIIMPTPVILEIRKEICYPNLTDDLFCFVLIYNNQSFMVENISAEINLHSVDGSTITSQIAIPPLNILPPDKKIILVANFTPPIPENYVIESQLLSSIPVSSENQRYLDLLITTKDIRILGNKIQAQVSGEISLTKNEVSAERIWVVGIAYDSDNTPVGYRKWESDLPLAPGKVISFDFIIYSLGPNIDHIEILTESTP